MTRKVAVIPHTHWDREWYAGFQYFRARLLEVVSALLDRLERDPSHRYFLLDGQMAMVDDYLELRPADATRIRSLVQAGRLSIGPWYVLSDEFLVSGETLVRNLQLGMARAAALGGHLPVGYLPDMFGHIGQMPQVLREAGLEHAVVWRGVPRAIDRTAFWWRAPDGSTIRAEYLPAGYSNGASIPDDPDALMRRLRAHEAQLAPFLRDEDPLLFMNGTDHQAPQPWLPAVAEAINASDKEFELRLTSLAGYLASAPTEALPSWTGELRSGARANLLMGVASNRVDVKVAAARAERALEALAEPLAALWLPDAWPGELLDQAWLEVIRNSAHDSICACSADEVGLAVRHRFAEATTIADGVVEAADRAMTTAFLRPGTVVVNPSAHARGGLVELIVRGAEPPPGAQVLDRVSAGAVDREVRGRDLARVLAELTETGWLDDGRGTSAAVEWTPDGVHLSLVWDRTEAKDDALRPVDSVMAEAAAQAAANPDLPLWVRVDRPASLRILALVRDVPGYGWASLPGPDGTPLPGLQAVWPHHAVEGTPAAPVSWVRGGDNWLDNGLVHVAVNPADGTFSVNGLAGLDRLVDGGDAGDTYNWSPPTEDLVVERPDTVACTLLEDGPLRGRLRVTRVFTWPERVEGGRRVGTSRVEVTTRLEVRAAEGLVRVTTSFDNPVRDHRLRSLFPLADRAAGSEAECAFGTAVRPLEAEGGPGEVGLPTFPSRRWVRAGGVTITHEGLLEYEVIDGGWALALTLLRATGVLSRPAPALRPNAAGPPLPTPDAQMVGPVEVRYGVAVSPVDPWRLAESAWVPLRVIHAAGGGVLPSTGSHLQVSGAEVSSLRRTGGALELRVFNPSDEATVVNVDDRSGWLMDLVGRPLDRWKASFPLRPWGIATVRLEEPFEAAGPGGLPDY